MLLCTDLLRRSTLASIVLAAGLAGCAGTPHAADGASDAAAKSGTDAEVALARRKAEIAELELQNARKHSEDAHARAQSELTLATAELARFDELEAPQRLARARLALAQKRDNLADEEEELAQLVMTYADVDLADKTREIVLTRSRRRIDRAKESAAIDEDDLKKLESLVLPHERARLALEVDTKKRALELDEKEANVTRLQKELALEEARAALAKLAKSGAER